jgi:hypothetical protein
MARQQLDLPDPVMRFCGEALPANSVFAFLHEHREVLFPDDMFADLFAAVGAALGGRVAWSPPGQTRVAGLPHGGRPGRRHRMVVGFGEGGPPCAGAGSGGVTGLPRSAVHELIFRYCRNARRLLSVLS